MSRSYDVRQLRFAAQPGLTVSEAESFYPDADIVWRGDPVGPRIPQIKSMFEEAVVRNRTILRGDTPIDLAITLVRFHGVSDRTRLSVGGIYNIVFDMTVLDARSGTVIEPTRRVSGNLSSRGLGDRPQRQSVTDFITGLLRQQLV
jgi:hypothetical protein